MSSARSRRRVPWRCGSAGSRAAVAALVLGVVLVLTGCGGDEPAVAPEVTEDQGTEDTDEPEASDQPEGPVDVASEVVAEGLAVPWDVAFTADGTYVTERDRGRVLRLDADGGVEVVASFEVDDTGEGGLLGLAPSPEYAEDGLLYAYYTAREGNRIVRFEPGEAPEPLVTGLPAAANHDGGRVAFGPDGMLYAGVGDAGNPAHAPDPGSLAGKVLRLTPDGGVPDDNPDPGSPVFASGLRNPQGLAWDADGRLYVTEFGPNVDDAVLRVEPGSDQGWGPQVAAADSGVRDFPDPVAVEQPPNASWSGATVLSDGAIPQWEGDLFAGALRGQRLWRFDLATGEREALYVEEFGRLRHAAQAPDGSLWLLTSNRDGRGDPVASDDRVIRIGPEG